MNRLKEILDGALSWWRALPERARWFGYGLLAALAALAAVALLTGCASDGGKAPADHGATSAGMASTLKSNDRALRRGEDALKAASEANGAIKAALPAVAREARDGASAHAAIWSDVNRIENATIVIDSALADIEANQAELRNRAREVEEKEAALSAREGRLADIEAANTESLLWATRIAAMAGVLVVVGGVLVAVATDARRTGWTIVVCGVALVATALALNVYWKQVAAAGAWGLVAVALAAGGAVVLTLWRRGRVDEVRYSAVWAWWRAEAVPVVGGAGAAELEATELLKDARAAAEREVKGKGKGKEAELGS